VLVGTNRPDNRPASFLFETSSAEEHRLVPPNIDDRSGLESPTEQHGLREVYRFRAGGYDPVESDPFQNRFNQPRDFNETNATNEPLQVPEDLGPQARRSPGVGTLRSESSIIDTPITAYPDEDHRYQHPPAVAQPYPNHLHITNEGNLGTSTSTVPHLMPRDPGLRERRSSTDLRRTNAVK
jgi:hypothetical protein